MAEIIQFETEPIPFQCESCGGNLWQMFTQDIPKQVILVCCCKVGNDICGAEASMDVE